MAEHVEPAVPRALRDLTVNVRTCRSNKRWRYASNRKQALVGSVAALYKAGSKMSASNRSISRERDSRAWRSSRGEGVVSANRKGGTEFAAPAVR